jgi:hydrogenase expression/formation protein HypD
MTRPFSFSDPARARALADAILLLSPPESVKIVHVCGTHELAITQHGLRRFLPERVEILEGPGCPVCVTPTRDIDLAVSLAEGGKVLCTFGDMTRVPGTRRTLEEARSGGADVHTVLSASEAVAIARKTDREVVFFAVGFETTAPTTAAVLLDRPPRNLSVLVSHKLIPPAMAALLELPGTSIRGYIAPGHVSTVIGTRHYEPFPKKYRMPVVIGGFEPLDVLYAIALVLRQVRDRSPRVENAYPRAVTEEGNRQAQGMMEKVFEVVDARWRGIGTIPASGLALRERFREFDARARFAIEGEEGEDEIPGCRCPDVLTARAAPVDCPFFSTRCTPLSPVGPCMVGSEGACSIWFRYGGRPRL